MKQKRFVVEFSGPPFQDLLDHPNAFARELFSVRHALVQVALMLKDGRDAGEIEDYVEGVLGDMGVTITPVQRLYSSTELREMAERG